MKLDIAYEINLRYRGGLFKYRKTLDDPFKWCWLVAKGYDSDTTNLTTKKKLTYQVNEWVPETEDWSEIIINLGDVLLDFSIPNVGYVNDTFDIYYLDRLPSKQWCRLLKDSTISIDRYDGLMDIIVDNGMEYDGKGWQHNIMKSIYNGYPTFNEALGRILDGERLATAFSREYALALSPHSHKRIWVLRKNEAIGVVDKVDDEYVIALPKSLEYIVEDLMQYNNTACYI